MGGSGQGWGAGVCGGGRGAAGRWGELSSEEKWGGWWGAGREGADPPSSKGSADSTWNVQFLNLPIG